MRLIFLVLTIRIKRRLAGLEPVAKIQSIFFAYFFGAIFATLPWHGSIKIYTHLADVQVIAAFRALVLP